MGLATAESDEAGPAIVHRKCFSAGGRALRFLGCPRGACLRA